MAQRTRIVVGFGGSSNSVAALNCALVEASLRDAVLALCHLRERSRPNGDRTWTNAAARQLLAHGTEHAHRRLPHVQVTPRLLIGSPARELLRVATDARMLVVGARGTSMSHKLRLGPVSDHVARHARRAVFVVPDLNVADAFEHIRVTQLHRRC
jgi:nucleotide-binding universal stress UspA family protein